MTDVSSDPRSYFPISLHAFFFFKCHMCQLSIYCLCDNGTGSCKYFSLAAGMTSSFSVQSQGGTLKERGVFPPSSHMPCSPVDAAPLAHSSCSKCGAGLSSALASPGHAFSCTRRLHSAGALSTQGSPPFGC